MKHLNQPKGHVYRFEPTSSWSDEAKARVNLSDDIMTHMVVVVAKSDLKRGWVRVATVTTTKDPGVDPDLYVPVHPTPKNRKTNMQLRLAHDPYGLQGFPLKSMLRADALLEVPLEILTEQLSHGRHLGLKEKSYNGLLHFLRTRSIIT